MADESTVSELKDYGVPGDFIICTEAEDKKAPIRIIYLSVRMGEGMVLNRIEVLKSLGEYGHRFFGNARPKWFSTITSLIEGIEKDDIKVDGRKPLLRRPFVHFSSARFGKHHYMLWIIR